MATRYLTLALVLCPSLLWAGPKKVTIVVDSAPRQALLYDRDTEHFIGTTPFKLKTTINPALGCQNHPGLLARWASGAHAEFAFVTICPKNGKTQHLRFDRPIDAPDLALDLQIAQAKEAQDQAQAIALASIITASITNAANAYANAYRPIYTPPVTCLTIPSAYAVQTWCR